MAGQFLAEIRLFAGNFAPVGWAVCNGQIMAISQNAALFSLLGTNFGGNGTSNFGLPNLQGRIPVGQGQGQGLTPRVVGEESGVPTVTLLTSEMPAHTHQMFGSTEDATLKIPGPTLFFGRSKAGTIYQSNTGNAVQMYPQELSPSGSSVAHNNMQPYLTLCYIIALQGIFPQRG